MLVIDRINSASVATPNAREYITYTGISTNTLTGVTRGVAGSTAQSHASGATTEETVSITHWNDLVSYLQVEHDSAGKHVISTATITTARIITHLNASGASVSGQFPINPVWVVSGYVSLATTSVGKPLPIPQAGTLQFLSAVLLAPASGATLILDVNKNFTSVFTDQNTRLMIPANGTYVSTASIGTTALASGNILTVDIDQGGGLGQDLTVLGHIT